MYYFTKYNFRTNLHHRRQMEIIQNDLYLREYNAHMYKATNSLPTFA